MSEAKRGEVWVIITPSNRPTEKYTMSRRLILLIASVAVSALFLVLALRGVPFEEVVNGIRQANPLWVGASLLTFLASASARTTRWRGLLGGRVRWIDLLQTYNLAMLLNLLPLRAGEVGRTVVLSTRFGVPLATAATSVIVERLFDLVMVIVLLALGLSQVTSVPEIAVQASIAAGIVAVVGFGVLIILARYPAYAQRLLQNIETRTPVFARIGLGKRLQEILVGLEVLTDARRLLHLIVWSLIAWTCSVSSLLCLVFALGISDNSVMLSILGVALASFSIAIPVSVASIGPFESAIRLAGDLIGLTAILSTTLGFLFHGIAALAYLLYGTISVITLGISIGDMMGNQRVPKTDVVTVRGDGAQADSL